MIRRAVVTFLAALVAVMIGGLGTQSSAAPSPDAQSVVYTYDAPVYDAPENHTAADRGPPVNSHAYDTYDAVDLRSHGTLARLSGPGLCATYDYDYDPAGLPVESAIVAGATVEPARAYVGDLSAFARWQVAAKTAGGLSDDYARLATQHVTHSGDTVLGHFPGYIDKAKARGASYFDVGDEWNAIVARGDDPWALNQHFLEGRIAAGDRMLLSLPKSDIRPGSYLAREVQYLQSSGYQWVNQWALRPGG